MSLDTSRVKPEIDLSVEGGAWPAPMQLEALAAHAIAAAIEEAQPVLMPGVTLSLLCCDDARIRDINRDWRGFDKATNVLSFPAVTTDRLAQTPFLGDIAIAYETVSREADEAGKTFDDHLAHLIIHGFLHLLGEDHETDEQAERMEALERKALARLGIGDPYADAEPDA
jgi:probable rRNA maturation factor